MPYRLVERLGGDPRLQAIAQPVAERVRPLFHPRLVKHALSGGWLGHRLHPMLTDAVIGTWSSAAILDWGARNRGGRSSERLITAGLLASVPTVLSGLSDWSETSGRERAIGLAHAGANAGASVMYVMSLIDRRAGRPGRGRWFGLAGLSMMGIGGYLGAHLSYVNGVGVDRTAFHTGPTTWTPVLDANALPEADPRWVQADGRDVLLVRRQDGIRAFDGLCTHAGGRLADGQVQPCDRDLAGSVTCPLHGSVFSLDDGAVRRGPAASPQPQLDVRVVDGQIEVRSP